MPKSWAFRTPPPSYRRRIVTPYPDTRPVPTLHRLSGPRAGTQGTGAETPTTVIPHQHPLSPRTPSCRRRPVPRGRARKPPLPSSPTNTPTNVHVPPRSNTVIPPHKPEPRRAWLPPQPSTSTYTCHPPANTVVPASPCTPIQGRNPEVRVGQREYDTNRVPPVPATNVCRGGSCGRPPGSGRGTVTQPPSFRARGRPTVRRKSASLRGVVILKHCRIRCPITTVDPRTRGTVNSREL